MVDLRTVSVILQKKIIDYSIFILREPFQTLSHYFFSHFSFRCPWGNNKMEKKDDYYD